MKSIGYAAIFAGVLGSAAVQAQGLPAMNLCAGSPSGNYTWVANLLKTEANKAYNINVVQTAGSLENLRRLMDGSCDAGIVQSDVRDLFILENSSAINDLIDVKSLYTEYVHVLCPVAANFNRINDLGKRNAKMLGLPAGSGSAETWRALRKADEGLYGKMEVSSTSGLSAVSDIIDNNTALAKKTTTKASCMLWVSGLNSADMQAANRYSVNNPKKEPALKLIDVNDSDIKGIKNSFGEPMYPFETITRREPKSGVLGLYDNLIPSAFFGSSSVQVPTVTASLVFRKDFYDKTSGKSPYVEYLKITIEDMKPTIMGKVNPESK